MELPRKERNFIRWFLTALIVISAVWLVYGISFYFIPKTWASKGQVGDSFGALNSLFSGLAFAGLIIGLYMQREELALQREELKATREEMTKQVEAQQKSEKALRDQVKTQAVAALVNGHNSIINNVEMQITTLMQYKTAAANQRIDELRKNQQDHFEALGARLNQLNALVDAGKQF